MQWSLTMNLKAHAKGRPRLGRFGNVFTPAATREAENSLKAVFRANSPPCFKGALSIRLVFQLSRPKSVSAIKRPYAVCRPDLDNYVKTVLDAANGLLFIDDAQIVELSAKKEYGPRDQIYILVTELHKPTSALSQI